MQDISWLSRTKLLIGEEKLLSLTQKHVMVVGLGGVGSYAAEFIARSGVGKMTIIDGDVVDPTNRNRQLPALATNHGQPKARIMEERLSTLSWNCIRLSRLYNRTWYKSSCCAGPIM
jgi:tRNA A37 threonylcarbamoyladenosine dehydratase